MAGKFTCCICGAECQGYGNNPSPVVDDPDARCCDECNSEKVIPARIKEAIRKSFAKTDMDEKAYSRNDVLAVADDLMVIFSNYVNAVSTASEQDARDALIYPMVLGANLLANMLAYDAGESKIIKALDNYTAGKEFVDSQTGTKMRAKVPIKEV